MARSKHPIMHRRWLWAFILSILLHFLMLLTCLRWKPSFFQGTPAGKPDDPLVFEWIEDEQPQTVIETGEESKEAPKRADFLSDRQSIAANEMPAPEKGSMPFSEGQVEMGSIHPLPEFSGSWQNEDPPAPEERKEREEEGVHVEDRKSVESKSFSRDRLLGINRPSSSNKLPEPAYKELQSSVEQSGGISFNTYAWEYAPYLLKLKDRIQKNIFPPASFTRLGFGGSHLIRFRIKRDGTLSSVTLLGHEGDRVLTETSMNSLQLSSPFWPLPEDFSESYLEVTALFRYFGKESYQ